MFACNWSDFFSIGTNEFKHKTQPSARRHRHTNTYTRTDVWSNETHKRSTHWQLQVSIQKLKATTVDVALSVRSHLQWTTKRCVVRRAQHKTELCVSFSRPWFFDVCVCNSCRVTQKLFMFANNLEKKNWRREEKRKIRKKNILQIVGRVCSLRPLVAIVFRRPEILMIWRMWTRSGSFRTCEQARKNEKNVLRAQSPKCEEKRNEKTTKKKKHWNSREATELATLEMNVFTLRRHRRRREFADSRYFNSMTATMIKLHTKIEIQRAKNKKWIGRIRSLKFSSSHFCSIEFELRFRQTQSQQNKTQSERKLKC